MRKWRIKKDKPGLRKDVVMLDDHLFKLDLRDWAVSISIPNGRLEYKLLQETIARHLRTRRLDRLGQ